MRSDLLCFLHLQHSAGSHRENVSCVGLEKDSLSCGPLVLFCAVVPTCKPAQTVLPCGVLEMMALKLTELLDSVIKWGYRYERQMAWKLWH